MWVYPTSGYTHFFCQKISNGIAVWDKTFIRKVWLCNRLFFSDLYSHF